jgi:hypothetical protein
MTLSESQLNEVAERFASDVEAESKAAGVGQGEVAYAIDLIRLALRRAAAYEHWVRIRTPPLDVGYEACRRLQKAGAEPEWSDAQQASRLYFLSSLDELVVTTWREYNRLESDIQGLSAVFGGRLGWAGQVGDPCCCAVQIVGGLRAAVAAITASGAPGELGGDERRRLEYVALGRLSERMGRQALVRCSWIDVYPAQLHFPKSADYEELLAAVDRLWAIAVERDRLDEAESPVASAKPGSDGDFRVEEPGDYVFRRKGEGWEIVFGEERNFFQNTDGFKYMYQALKSPNKPLECVQLRGAEYIAENMKGLSDVIDDDTVKDCEEEIVRIDSEIADLGQAELDDKRRRNLEEEKSQIVKYLGSARGLKGRRRPLQSDAKERARKSVSAAVNRSRQRLLEADPPMEEAAKHLAAVRIEDGCLVYRPEPPTPPWEF